MRILITLLLGAACIVLPQRGFAESADVEAVIEGVDENKLTVTLDDGRKYRAPDEFDFQGLKRGVKVIVFYTETDGRREINDLQVI